MLGKLLIAIISLSSVSLTVVAADKPDLSKLKALLGGSSPQSVNSTPIAGFYEVVVDGQLLYLTEDGRFAIQGDVVDLATANNLTETRRSVLRLEAVNAVGEQNMVVFAPSKPARHTVTVFTDIDCGYCRKLHQEIASYNDNGIKIRYLMFPRAGIGSDSYEKAVTVWCSPDRQNALTLAKQGGDIGHKSCANPVKEQYELGQSLGVRGTPSMILENGQMVPGYVPAARLAQMLDSAGAAN